MEYYHATMENIKFGVNIGDMFNALASFCCLKRKLNDNTTFYFVTHPSRFFLVNLFSKYGAVPIEYDKCKDKQIKSLWINSTGFLNYVRKEYNREMIYWDYFERFNLTSDDLISFYETIIPNKIENNIVMGLLISFPKFPFRNPISVICCTIFVKIKPLCFIHLIQWNIYMNRIFNPKISPPILNLYFHEYHL